MAIVKNMWLRGVSKKIGGSVYYQQGGETRWRELAASISNPRTDAQMEQRVKLANLVAFYRVSKKWMRGAFETKPANQSDYNAFVSANAATNTVCLTKTQVESGNAVVAPYQVTRGSLGEVTLSTVAGQVESNLYIGDLTFEDTLTVAQLTAALLANNNGLQEGDQLSIIQYIQNTSTTGNYTIACRPYEMILSLSSTRLVSDYLPLDILLDTGGDTSALAIDTSGFVGGVTIVISRTTAARLLVSSSSVALTYNNSVYASMTTTTQQQAAIDSYGEATTIFLDSNLASEANSGVSTAPRILSLVIGGYTYGTSDVIPCDYTNGELIIINTSAPVTVLADAAMSIGNNLSGGGAEGECQVLGQTTGTTFVYKLLANKTLPQNTDVVVEFELSNDDVISQTWHTTRDGNGEGLG